MRRVAARERSTSALSPDCGPDTARSLVCPCTLARLIGVSSVSQDVSGLEVPRARNLLPTIPHSDTSPPEKATVAKTVAKGEVSLRVSG